MNTYRVIKFVQPKIENQMFMVHDKIYIFIILFYLFVEYCISVLNINLK